MQVPAPSTRPVYRGAIAAGLLALAAFVALALLVSTPAGEALDRTALGAVQTLATPDLVAAMGWVTRLGSEGIALALPVLLIGLWWRGLRWQAVELLVVTGGAQLFNDLLKLAFHRARPTAVASVIPGQAYSFPSGHAMVSIAFYGALAYVGWRLLHGWRRDAWMGFMGLLVLAVGASRLFLDVHFPTDVLASWAAGLLWLDVALTLVGAASRRWSARAAAAP